MSYKPNAYTLFFQKVDTQNFQHDKCWIWTGATKGNGYGNVRLKDKNITAHRYAYQLFIGDVPDNLDVCHTCDNRFCVNPDHLFLGSRKQNMQDAKKKGRTCGCHKKKLKESTIQECKRLILLGNPVRKVVLALNISTSTYYKIKKEMANA